VLFNFLVYTISAKRFAREKLAKKLFWLRSGSGRFQKTDPDPFNNCPDPQHCFINNFDNFNLKKTNRKPQL
jgi:hypothetical protein